MRIILKRRQVGNEQGVSIVTIIVRRCLPWVLCALAACLPAGCGDHLRGPSAAEVVQFEAAEPGGPSIDMDRVLQARITPGPYHTAVGDTLQIELPRILNSQSLDGTAAEGRETYTCRIGDDGAIILPVVGPFPAAGRTLAQIEAGILAQYYPKYIKALFPVYASVQQYNTRRVSIVGAVAQPGVYSLRPDQMSLVSLLMEAGGIVQQGAAVIRIARRDAATSDASGIRTSAGVLPPQSPAPVLPDEPPPFLRATFEREGPLKTSGWLEVTDPNGTPVRRWCDLASEAQTAAFIHAVAALPGPTPVGDLQKKLARLALALESAPFQCEVGPVAQECGWEMDQHRFVTAVSPARIRKRIPSSLAAPVSAVSPAEDEAATTLVLPVKGLNIPFADVTLQEGDSVVVEWPREQFISVLGLVRDPGNFPYPQNSRYNLIQAIGFAGGLDPVADPRYVSVYRLQPDGQIATLTVHLVNPKHSPDLTDSLALSVKPGDVVSVEHTPRTRTNVFFDRFFRITFGLYVDPRDLWDEDR